MIQMAVDNNDIHLPTRRLFADYLHHLAIETAKEQLSDLLLNAKISLIINT